MTKLRGLALVSAWALSAVVASACVADDAGVEGDGVCADPRQFNDRKQAQDFCWEPPAHYCAQGGSAAVVRACAPDFSVCCTFATSCFPCGWSDCVGQPDPRCDTAPLDSPACEAPEVRPDLQKVFCFD